MDNIVFVCPTGALPGVPTAVRGFWLPFAPRLHIVNYPFAGILGLETNYASAEKQLLARFRRHGKLRLAGWSQGANHSLRFTLNHPDKVERLLLIAAPLKGSWFAEFFPWVPAARDMRPGSLACQHLAAELQEKAKSLPNTVVLVAVQDGIIHSDAAKLPGVYDEGFPIQYHVFSNLPPVNPPDTTQLHWHWAPGAFHLTMGFHPVVLWYIYQALCGLVGEVIPSDPESHPYPA